MSKREPNWKSKKGAESAEAQVDQKGDGPTGLNLRKSEEKVEKMEKPKFVEKHEFDLPTKWIPSGGRPPTVAEEKDEKDEKT